MIAIAQQFLLAQSTSDYKIPFTLTSQNNIIIKATLNNQDTVSLMFHTAASALTLTKDAIGKMNSLQFERTDTVKSWGGAENSSRYSKSNMLQIGNHNWENIPLWENLNSGPGSGGKFGLELFNNKVLELNFDKKTITVSQNLPSDIKSYNKLNLIYKDEMMFVEAECKIGNDLLKNQFLIHSGYSGAILFDDQFTTDNQLNEKLKITGEKSLKDSFGNLLKTKKAIVTSFIIGKNKLNNVPSGFFQGALGRQKMSIIGSDLLKRFNVVISADRNTIFLKANTLKNTTYLNI
ncbi:hypothetical protein GCM10008119_26470 [Pedobacter mendelii]|uniref:Aspartyl protease n=2 Tax=Pedobacter mendelii TaxID=1908240 RepID=A0ABQ2BIN7_9SPHI|nr:hypothetical protein GCM10008119_26470 [Pedobacter mendelii]